MLSPSIRILEIPSKATTILVINWVFIPVLNSVTLFWYELGTSLILFEGCGGFGTVLRDTGLWSILLYFCNHVQFLSSGVILSFYLLPFYLSLRCPFGMLLLLTFSIETPYLTQPPVVDFCCVIVMLLLVLVSIGGLSGEVGWLSLGW